MKTPFDLDKIYNKLPKEKTELSIEKVELNVADDVKKIISQAVDTEEKYDSIFKNVLRAENNFDKHLNDIKQVQKKLSSIKKKTEKAIDELGVNRNTFGLMDDIDKWESKLASNYKQVSSQLNKLKSI